MKQPRSSALLEHSAQHKSNLPTRRRVITIAATGLAATGAAVLGIGGASAAAVIHEWSGQALGGETTIKLAHEDRATALQVLARCRDEIERLEDIFSLYRPSSEVCRLNRDGFLSQPSLDLAHCLAESHLVSALTDGAFDITVAPVWDLTAASAEISEKKLAAAQKVALEKVGFAGVMNNKGRIALARPGMAITLNGIAQGYITDRICALLRTNGFDKALVGLGELRALEASGQKPWRVQIEGSDQVISLENKAIATSAADGTIIGGARALSHLVDPRGLVPKPLWAQVTVVAPTAARADALSTGLSFVEQSRWPVIMRRAGASFAIGQTWAGPLIRADQFASTQI